MLSHILFLNLVHLFCSSQHNTFKVKRLHNQKIDKKLGELQELISKNIFQPSFGLKNLEKNDFSTYI